MEGDEGNKLNKSAAWSYFLEQRTTGRVALVMPLSLETVRTRKYIQQMATRQLPRIYSKQTQTAIGCFCLTDSWERLKQNCWAGDFVGITRKKGKNLHRRLKMGLVKISLSSEFGKEGTLDVPGFSTTC